MTQIDLNALITTKTAATELGISERRVRALIEKHNLGIKIAETWFLTPEDMATLRNRSTQAGRPSSMGRRDEVEQIVQNALRELSITDRVIVNMDNPEIYQLSRRISQATANLDSMHLEPWAWANLIRAHLAKRRRILLGRQRNGENI